MKSVTGASTSTSAGVSAALGDDRYLDHLGPPGEELAIGDAAVAELGRARGAEGDVVGADLGRGHALVPRGPGVGADDAVGAERLAHGADLPGAVGEVDAVEAEPLDQAEVVGDDEGHVAGVADRAEEVAGPRDLVLGRAGEREAHAGDVEAVEERRETLGHLGRRRRGARSGRAAPCRRRPRLAPQDRASGVDGVVAELPPRCG